MSRAFVPLAAVLLAFVPACTKPAEPAPPPPAVIIAPEPAEPQIVYDGIAPPPRAVPLAGEPSAAKDAMELRVSAVEPGMWRFEHPSGARELHRLHLPLGKPVTLVLNPAKGAGRFEIPAFGVGVDVADDHHKEVTFKPTRTGTFDIWRGRERAGTVTVLPVVEFDAWLIGVGLIAKRPKDEPPASRGRQLFLKNHCARCHTATPDAKAPNLEGLYGTKVALKGGGAEIADDQYLIESIRRPRAKIVEGWEVGMPAYDESQISAEEMTELLAYLKALKLGDLNRKEERFPAPVGAPTERPKEPPPK